MPSGAKKRKAARKKKENHTYFAESTNGPQGTEHEVKSQHEKDSDVGDVNSPPPQDEKEHENTFSKETELVYERDHSAIPPLPADNNSSSGEETNGLSEDGLMENAESVVVSNDKNGEHSTVTLVDRSGMCDKKLQEESFNSVTGAVANDDLVRTSHSSSNEVAVTNIPVQKAVSMFSESSTLSADKPFVFLSEWSSQATEQSPTRKPVINVENGTPAARTDLRFNSLEDKEYPPPDVNVKNDEFPSSYLTVVAQNNSDEYVKDSGIPEYSDDQPLIASAPRVLDRTSWLSCCGLFEVLSGSNK